MSLYKQDGAVFIEINQIFWSKNQQEYLDKLTTYLVSTHTLTNDERDYLVEVVALVWGALSSIAVAGLWLLTVGWGRGQELNPAILERKLTKGQSYAESLLSLSIEAASAPLVSVQPAEGLGMYGILVRIRKPLRSAAGNHSVVLKRPQAYQRFTEDTLSNGRGVFGYSDSGIASRLTCCKDR